MRANARRLFLTYDPTIPNLAIPMAAPPCFLTIFANDGCVTGQIESNYDETVDSFDDMNLKSELLRGGECYPSSTPARSDFPTKRGQNLTGA